MSPCASLTSTNLLHLLLIQEDGVAFVRTDDVDSSKPELATELSRTRRLVSHEFVTEMKAKFREMILKRMAAGKEVCVVHVGHRCFINSYQCSLPTLLLKTRTVPPVALSKKRDVHPSG